MRYQLVLIKNILLIKTNSTTFDLKMLNKSNIQRLIATTFLLMVVPFAFAAFTLSGNVDEKARNSKYSLKNISKYSQKSFSLSSLRTNLQYKGSLSISRNSGVDNSIFNSYIQIDKGNTTYTMPYKMKIKAPRFKTPSPNN